MSWYPTRFIASTIIQSCYLHLFVSGCSGRNQIPVCTCGWWMICKTVWSTKFSIYDNPPEYSWKTQPSRYGESSQCNAQCLSSSPNLEDGDGGVVDLYRYWHLESWYLHISLNINCGTLFCASKQCHLFFLFLVCRRSTLVLLHIHVYGSHLRTSLLQYITFSSSSTLSQQTNLCPPVIFY